MGLLAIIIGIFFCVVGVCLIVFGIREGILKGKKEDSKIKKGSSLLLGTIAGLIGGASDKASSFIIIGIVSIVMGFLFLISY